MRSQRLDGQPSNSGEPLDPGTSSTSSNLKRKELQKDPTETPAKKRIISRCPICLKKMRVPDEQMSTPCAHVFCTICLLQSFEYTKTCPICRRTIEETHVEGQEKSNDDQEYEGEEGGEAEDECGDEPPEDGDGEEAADDQEVGGEPEEDYQGEEGDNQGESDDQGDDGNHGEDGFQEEDVNQEEDPDQEEEGRQGEECEEDIEGGYSFPEDGGYHLEDGYQGEDEDEDPDYLPGEESILENEGSDDDWTNNMDSYLFSLPDSLDESEAEEREE